MKLTIPQEEYVNSGHLACQGCGATLALRTVLKALGPKTIMTVPACCMTVIDGPFPYTAVKIPLMHTPFETAAVAASGVKAALEVRGDNETTVLAWAGDGGTFDIGIQALSGAAERNADIIYVCYDNEAYMNTGIQRSSSTPMGAWTTTTPVPHHKKHPKKNMLAIMAAHGIPYTATASVAFLEDLVKKVKKAKEIRGTKFLHILAPCPSGWKCPPHLMVKMARLAVQTNVFPLYEIEDGEKYTINMKPTAKPVEEYLKLQGRFSHLTQDEVSIIQANTDKNWNLLLKKAEGYC